MTRKTLYNRDFPAAKGFSILCDKSRSWHAFGLLLCNYFIFSSSIAADPSAEAMFTD